MCPGMAIGRVFQHAAEAANSAKSSLETAGIIAQFELVWLACAAVPEATPTLAWRMGHHGMRACIGTGVSRFRPHIHTGKAGIDTIRLDIQGGNHSAPAATSWAMPRDGHTRGSPL